MTNITIPEDATDYIKDYKITYYKRIKAFNMNLLEYWTGSQWKMCSYLPWNDIRPIEELKKND